MIKKLISIGLLLVLCGPATVSAFEGDTPPGPPPGFVLPPLHPGDTELTTRPLGEGVYALLSETPFVDNSGFIVGEDGVLVIDAHVSVGMAAQIQQAVRAVTDKPILYLVNTNFHGDHTFGNASFPEETRIIAHVETARRMQAIDAEKAFLLPLLENDRALLDKIRLRLPDVVFEDSLRIDLGGRVVEIHHFGHGNTPGDTIVYTPDSRVAWTGNFMLGDGSIPFLVEGHAAEWAQTLTRFAARLDVDTIIPGHGTPAGAGLVSRYLAYLNEILATVRSEVRAGRDAREILASNPLPAGFLPPDESTVELFRGIHLWNLQRVHWDLTR